MAAGIRIVLRNLAQVNAQVQDILAATAEGGGRFSKTELHRRYGIQALQWINQNFRSGGGLLEDGRWKPLSANTIAGRRKGSSEILQDTGILRASFTYKTSSQEVRVGTEHFAAKWHEDGTKGPYEIRPRNALALAFPVSGKVARFARVTNFNSATGLNSTRQRASRVAASFSSLATQKTYKRGQNLILAMKVIHPGLVKRRMLPNEQEMLPRLLQVTIGWMRQSRLFRSTEEAE